MITVLCSKYDKCVAVLLEKLNNRKIENCVIVGNEQTLQKYALSASATSKALVFIGDSAEMKQLIAQAYGLTMFYDKYAEKNIDAYCRLTKQPSPPQYMMDRLCALPESFNNYASAYGMQCACYGEHNKCHIFVVPKDEREIEIVYNTYIDKMLQRLYTPSICKIYKIFGMDKQEIIDKIGNIVNNKFVTFDCFTDDSMDSKLTVIINKNASPSFVSGLNQRICQTFDNYLYADKDTTLQQEVVNTLKDVHKTVAVAESLTGGLISSQLVEVQGASKVLYEGVVTYSVDAKCKRLGLSPHFIDRYGVVSNEVAYQMADSLIKSDNVDFSIATTGIAGPDTYGSQPVGLCYIGIGSYAGVKVYRNIFCGNRDQIRRQATNSALFLLLQTIKTKQI